MTGFWIFQIKASGDSKKDAEIKLKKGANVITGPSDTGKSYLFSVVNYVLGRTTMPDKDIPEGIGYDKFSLIIEAFSNQSRYILERKLYDNKISVSEVVIGGVNFINTYRAKLALSNPLNISNFLLGLCDLQDSILLKNRLEGKKQLLSFKNINQFTNIAEERIITKSSPFYFSNNNANHILEQSMLSLILDREDFSKVEAIENRKIKETRISGKLEFIDSQIIDYSRRRESLSLDIASLEERYVDFNEVLLRNQINERLEAAHELEQRITSHLKDISQVTEDKVYHEELINRFKILERLYLSDRDRLEFILEAESLTSQLPSRFCPICSSPMDDEQVEHLAEIAQFKESIIAERQIIGNKIEDLNSSIKDSELRVNNTRKALASTRDSLNILNDKNSKVNPEIQNLKAKLTEFLDLKRLTNNLEFLDKETENLYLVKDEFERKKAEKESTDIVNVCDYEVLKKLSGYIQKRLEKWNYEKNVKVIFNSEFQVFDIVISNKGRGSFGKGKRAISYSACLMGFLDFCLKEDKKFSNLIVLDSPLTTYKGADRNVVEEDVSGLEDSFFLDISKTPKEAQIIIFENKVPQNIDDLNVIEFTRSVDVGRYGFYPVQN